MPDMDSWFLKVLANNWRVFRTKEFYKNFSQKGHTWIRLPGTTWAPCARKRNYKCKSCGTDMYIIFMSGRPQCSIFYKNDRAILHCEELGMDEALR